MITPLILEAEKFVHYTCQEKKEYVMTKTMQQARDANIKFDEIEASYKIEELVGLTKLVNIKTSKNLSKLKEE